VFAYEEPVVHLIHDCKIRGHGATADFLARKFLESLHASMICKDVDAVMPAPSSLWSRCRGRLDLARALSDAIATTWRIPLLSPPRQLLFAAKKQAKKAKRNMEYMASGNQQNPSNFRLLNNLSRTLIVDDVVTTGFTLNSVVHAVNGRFCRFAALASPYPDRWKPTRLGFG
jgi:predicted amidophosphoribosyltransferase